MTLEFLRNVHLSAKFGGIEHGQKLKSPDIKQGEVVNIKNDELAGLLLDCKLAKKVKLTEPDKASNPLSGTKETELASN